MSHTFGHTNHHSRPTKYRTAKPWRTAYNHVVRHLNRVNTDCKTSVCEDVIFPGRNEISAGNMRNHIGD
jgi:hypothetical protein